MAVVPDTRLGKIQFYENHTTPWAANAVAIGTTTTAVTDLTTKTTAARAAFNAQQAAQQVAKAATLAYNDAVAVMQSAGADIIKAIKAKAAVTGNSVYELAQIPAPATPSPLGPPGAPFEFVVELSADGALLLKWKCNNPAGSQGTIYQVYRRIGGTGAFSYLGGSGKKEFIDATVPAGSSQVTYQLQGVRSTAIGPWAQFNVNFGVGGGGSMMMEVSEGVPSMIAA